MTLKGMRNAVSNLPRTAPMPVLFVGHGSPTNAIEDNAWTQAWTKLGETLPRPKAILAISAHWLTEGSLVHVAAKPKTIHDFYGFPKPMYDIRYACDGSPKLAKDVRGMVRSAKVAPDEDWGLDHGTWVPLERMYPLADVPTFQLSMDATKRPQFHYELGRELSELRDRGVLILASGNIVHHLGMINFDEHAKPYDWATEFDEVSARLIGSGDHASLIDYAKLGQAAHMSIPTPDHYWPLLYALGLERKGERVTFPTDGIAYGSVSMRSVLIGD